MLSFNVVLKMQKKIKHYNIILSMNITTRNNLKAVEKN